MADLASFQAVVHGRVQGVFFRASVETWAIELKLAGYVRNRPDGSVEVLAEGERERLEKLLRHLQTGPPASKVKDVTASWGEYSGGHSGFEVRY